MPPLRRDRRRLRRMGDGRPGPRRGAPPARRRPGAGGGPPRRRPRAPPARARRGATMARQRPSSASRGRRSRSLRATSGSRSASWKSRATARAGPGDAHEGVEEGGRVLRGRGEPVEAAVRRPDRRAGVEGRGRRLAERHGAVLLRRDEVEDGRPRRPELGDLLRDVIGPPPMARRHGRRRRGRPRRAASGASRTITRPLRVRGGAHGLLEGGRARGHLADGVLAQRAQPVLPRRARAAPRASRPRR